MNTFEKLRQYGGRLLRQGQLVVVELQDLNDNAKRRFQYAVIGGQLKKRTLNAEGYITAPWEPVGDVALREMMAARGEFHPILDPLGL